ncbi:DUF937 domain-containing protein [candidate division KSB1 bacterium]|nr:DUF937 domain-containing protein [candidate division KSB1 bacterium]
MNTVVDEFMKAFGPQVSKQLASNLGINTKTAQQMLPQIAPLILGGLKKQMQEKGGAPRIDHILNKYGNQNVLENISSVLSQRANDPQPDPRLGGLLGESGVQATQMLAKQFNLNSDTAMKIIPMLTPLLLGFLTKKRDTQGLGSQGIAALIDQNGDGQILDDVVGFLMKGMTSGGKGGGNVLGSLLGSLLGGRK